MSKSFLRGLSIGIILITSIFTLYLNPFKDEKYLEEQQKLSDQAVSTYLKSKGQTVITLNEYNSLKQTKEDYTKLEDESSQLNETKEQQKAISYGYRLEIKEGMNSPDVSEELENANIIESAKQLEEYLQTMDWESSIQIGIFEVKSEMTLEEIAKIITKKG
ncbi:hypothetical protein ACOI1C_02530 [Bacillus sp. DJP31]|uniref:hypothetical protein n=1 Tax=Bacillus sp. DJP31 TaxID=3409789 RepID=UPI003BB7AE57